MPQPQTKQIAVRAPDGTIGLIPAEQEQDAANAGYTPVAPDEAEAALSQFRSERGEAAALQAGVTEAPADYSTARAFGEKALSAFTFGLAPEVRTPEAVARGARYAEEHPYGAFGAELVGQLPMAVVGGVAGEVAVGGAVAAGFGRAAMAGVRAGEFGAQAALGGAQTEAELARVEQREFNPTNAAIVGVFGEGLGRGAAYGFSKGLGFSRNLLARGEQRAVAQDAAESVQRGGVLNDFRVAAHADTYQKELASLAADDLDALETAFAEVSRQDRKRLRVGRLIEDLPEAQHAVRVELHGAYQQLYDGLFAEVGEGAPAPARRLLDQLRGRMDQLAQDAPIGRKLWKQLDENRQALQEYAQDLHTSYENAPGSAWLSRDGLRLLDDATRKTREALLREDAWGRAAAAEQAAYNKPFNEKFFPNDKTVRGRLMFETGVGPQGRPVFRGDPGKVRQLFQRGADDVDAARLSEQFREWLDGVEAISRAGERDVPAAASEALERVRRLRKALSHAEFVQQVSERVTRRADVAEVLIGAGAGLALAGPAGAVFGGAAGQAARGLRLANWLARAAHRVGWAGSPESMAALLGREALPRQVGPNVPTRDLADDVLDSPPPGRPDPSDTPPPEASPAAPGAPPAAPAAPAGPGGGAAPAAPPGGAQAAAPTPRAEAPTGQGLSPVELDAALRQLRATGDRAAIELANQLDTPAARAELKSAGLLAADRAPVDTPLDDQIFDALDGARGGVSPEALAAKFGLSPAEATEAIARLEKRGLAQVDEYGRVRARDVGAAEATPVDAGPAAIEQKIGEVAPDLARWLEQNKQAVVTGKAQAKQWFDQLVADAPEPAKLDPLARHRPGAQTPGVQPGPHPYLAEPLGGQGGITAGGFFKGADGQVRYVKFADRAHQLNEMANTEMYRDFGVESIKFEPVVLPKDQVADWKPGAAIERELHRASRGAEPPIAIASVKVGPEWVPVDDLAAAQRRDPKVIEQYLRGVPADIVIGNWDIAGNPGNVLVNTKTGQVMRLDAGEAGLNSAIPMRGLVRKEWEGLQEALTFRGRVAAARPDSLIHKLPLARAKAVLLEEFERIERVFRDAGGVRAYFEKRFPHVPPAKLHAHADQVQQNLQIAKSNATTLAAMALLLGNAVFGGDEANGAEPGADAAAATAPGAAGGGFAATAGLFSRARAKLVANVARRLFSTLAEPTVRTAARLTYSRAQLEARRQEIQSWADDPSQLVDRAEVGLRDTPPDAFAATSAAMYAAVTFLKAKLPQASGPLPVAAPGAAPPVSAEAAAKYARYEQAALEPGEALREAAEVGYLSPELLETLTELYPDLLAELRVAAFQTVSDAAHGGRGGTRLSIQARTQYARLFDGDGTLASPAFSPTATKAYAYAYAQSVATANPPAPAGPRPGVSQVAAAVAAPTPWAPS